jgi:hypothetical protein
MLEANVGTWDRAARFVVGLLLIAFALPLGLPHTGWNWVGWVGLIPLITAIFGTCPLYGLFGISTCPIARR